MKPVAIFPIKSVNYNHKQCVSCARMLTYCHLFVGMIFIFNLHIFVT